MQNPTLQIAREQVAQARARVSQAVALPEPSFGLSVADQQGFLRRHTGGSTDLSLDLTIPFPQKLRLSGQIAQGDLGSFDESYALQRQIIVLQTNQAYDSVLVVLQHRRDLEEARQLAQQFLAGTQARYDAGTTQKLDVTKATVAVAQAELDLIANERGVANAREGLNRLLGRPLDATLEATDSLAIPAALPDLVTLEQLAMASRPELRALEQQRAGAHAASRLARQYYLPDVTISVSRSNVYGDKALFSTGIGIDLPLFPWQRQRGPVAETQHRQLELDAQYLDLVAQVGQDLRSAYASASTALRAAIHIRDQLLPAAREEYRIASTSYALGGSSALEVVEAQRTLLDAQTQYTATLAAANDAMADLERASGSSLAAATNGAGNAP